MAAELSDVIGDWVKSRRAAGVAPHDVLEALGLQVSQEAAVDESALWAMVALLVEEHRQRAQPRRRLATADGLTAVVDLVRRSERIMVVAGAGASASAGLPDFRVAAAASAHSESPDALFDVHHFVNDPKPLYALAAEMWTGKALPTPTHMFVRELERRGQLLRLYSENIDALELAAGIERRVLCHGWCASASCIACKAAVGAEALRAALAAGEESWPLRCAKCTHGLNLVKPDVACFGEPPPPEVERSLREDLKSADLLLFIGSDARVHPLAAVAPALPRDVPQLLVGLVRLARRRCASRTRPTPSSSASATRLSSGSAPSSDGRFRHRRRRRRPRPMPNTPTAVRPRPIPRGRRRPKWPRRPSMSPTSLSSRAAAPSHRRSRHARRRRSRCPARATAPTAAAPRPVSECCTSKV